MGRPDNETAPDPTLVRVVPRWSAARGRQNLVAIHDRIGRARRRGRPLTLALVGVAVCAGSIAVAAMMGMRVRRPEAAPIVSTIAREAERRGVGSSAAEPGPTGEVFVGQTTVVPRPATRVVPAAVPDVEALMRSADAARRAGHPGLALPYLRRLLREHPDDVRAPLAAFTMGRILLAELDRPAEAAEAFALSRRLAPRGPMASHALAREVEAAARSGDTARARRLAETYLADYPAGPHLAAVRRLGGIE